MKRETEKRLDALEGRTSDWVAELEIVDYGALEVDYENGDWEELHFDKIITAVRHRKTGEVRGYYRDRRTHAEMEAGGGDLAFL